MTDSPSRTPDRPPPPENAWGGTPRHRRGTSAGDRLIGRRWPRRVLIGANLLVALSLIGTASAYGYVNWRLGQIHHKKLPALTSSHTSKQAPFTLLIVGSDTRALTGTNNAQFGGIADVGGQRSDTVILARVVPATRQLMLMSIPRDLWIPIPGHGSNRINSALDTGPNLLIQTIEQSIGIPINHYVEVNFDSFRAISDAVGGVNFYFPTPARDAYSLLNVAAPGCYSVKGELALALVRSRHYEYYQNGYWHQEALSDLARIQRQQAFVKKLIKKAEGDYTDPIALNNIIGGVTKNLTVDSSFGTSLMLGLAKDFRTMDATNIPAVTLPTYGYVTAGGADVLGLQQPQEAQAVAAFNAFGNNTVVANKKASLSAGGGVTKPTLPPTTVAASSVNIEVANGTGAAGQASALSTVLSGLGYHAAVDHLSPGLGHATTEIRYAPDSLTAAQQLAVQIPGGGTLIQDPSLTPSPYNVEVITGTTYGGPAASGSGSGGTTAPTAGSSATTGPVPTTTVPGTNAQAYVLPGLPPGQTPPPC